MAGKPSNSIAHGWSPIASHYIEVELKAGTDEAAVAFAKALAEEFSLTEEPRSKFVRAMTLAMN